MTDVKSSEEKSNDDKTSDKKSIDEKPSDKKSIDEKPSDKKSIDEKASDKKSTDEKSTDKNTTDTNEKWLQMMNIMLSFGTKMYSSLKDMKNKDEENKDGNPPESLLEALEKFNAELTKFRVENIKQACRPAEEEIVPCEEKKDGTKVCVPCTKKAKKRPSVSKIPLPYRRYNYTSATREKIKKLQTEQRTAKKCAAMEGQEKCSADKPAEKPDEEKPKKSPTPSEELLKILKESVIDADKGLDGKDIDCKCEEELKSTEYDGEETKSKKTKDEEDREAFEKLKEKLADQEVDLQTLRDDVKQLGMKLAAKNRSKTERTQSARLYRQIMKQTVSIDNLPQKEAYHKSTITYQPVVRAAPPPYYAQQSTYYGPGPIRSTIPHTTIYRNAGVPSRPQIPVTYTETAYITPARTYSTYSNNVNLPEQSSSLSEYTRVLYQSPRTNYNYNQRRQYYQ